MRWLGGCSAACALAWLGLPPGLAALLGLAAIAAGAPRAAAVRALLFTADHAPYVRMRQGWRPLALRAATRGWRSLALQGELPAPYAPRRVAFTVWQDALPAPAWRRVSLLSHRRLRRVPMAGRVSGHKTMGSQASTRAGTA